jgi:hypothetical protein
MRETMIIEKAIEPRMNTDVHGFPMNDGSRQTGEFRLLTCAGFISVNPCSSVAN